MRYLFLFFLLPFAVIFSKEYFEELPEKKIHLGDYFSAGKLVELSGVVKGDAYVSGGKIFIDGRVEGDLIALGGTIEVLGEITGNVRIAGGDVKIYGTIGRNATIMAGNLQFFSGSQTQGNAHLFASTIDLGGKFAGNVNLMGSGGRIAAEILGNLKAYVGQLRLTSKASIQGKITYSESSEVQIDRGARLSGEVEKETSAFFRPNWQKTFVFSSRIVGLLMNFLFSFILGMIIIKFFPIRLSRSLAVLQEAPWKALGMGLLIVVLIPICFSLLFITVLGIPFALALAALAILSLYAAKVLPIIWVSNNLFSKVHLKKNSILVFFLGLIIFFILKQIIVVGILISFLFTLLGLGTAVLSRVQHPLKRKTVK